MRPNAISLLSVVFAAAASGALTFAAFVPGRLHLVLLLALAAACVQLRLLCNLLDGMVAVEGGFRTKVGELYNEFPDRVADVLILTGAGAFAGPVGLWLGALAALLAVLTAYVRALGVAAGASQAFGGPMAKPHRMAVVTAACLASMPEPWLMPDRRVMLAALAVIVLGGIVTIVRRLRVIASELNRK